MASVKYIFLVLSALVSYLALACIAEAKLRCGYVGIPTAFGKEKNESLEKCRACCEKNRWEYYETHTGKCKCSDADEYGASPVSEKYWANLMPIEEGDESEDQIAAG